MLIDREMKLFALLGLATYVYAESELRTAIRRRRLAAPAKCSFASNEGTGAVPNCMATFTWTMKDGDVDKITDKLHSYRCCVDKPSGWKTAGKNQLACTSPAATSDTCKDVKKDEEDCDTKIKKATKTDDFYSPGYSTTACSNNYADDCRSSLTCDTAGGYGGTPDLTCKTGYNNKFVLKGCGRTSVGVLGTDLTSSIYIAAPHTNPNRPGNIKSSFAECVSSAQFFKAAAFVATNGGCSQVKCTFSTETTQVCGVLPTWDRVLIPSDGEDTFTKPFHFKSKIAERCVDVANGQQPTLTSPVKICPNAGSQDDSATYGGFALYGQRLNCWRNMGGGIEATKSKDLTALDLTRQIFASKINAGIGKTLLEWETTKGTGNVYQFQGVWNGDGVTGNGYGVCDGVDAALGGCTAELGAIMCEAYNKELVLGGEKGIDKFCTGFVLQESKVAIGATAGKKTKKYEYTHSHDMLIGFFSKNGFDAKRNAGKSWNGGYFKYIPVKDCLVTATHSCSVCAQCIAGKVLTTEGACEAACPKHQYSKDGVCTYRTPHCIEGNAAGTECTKCHDGFKASADKTVCEEIGCAVPATSAMKSKANVLLVGKEQGTAAACVGGQNLVPGSSCGITCAAGKFSSDPSKTHVYSCSKAGPVTPPEIVCAACSVTKCDSCPSAALCDVCASGYVLSADKKTCTAKACPNGGTAGACTVCPLGTAGTLTWDFVAQDWDTSACEACTMDNCKDCKGNKAVCTTCATDYTKKAADGKECILLEYCPYGFKGRQTWVIATQKFATTSCTKDTTACEDTTQKPGECTDCKNGYAGKVDWDPAKQAFNKDQCHGIPCPVVSEPLGACKTCPLFTKGIPVWDDLFNEWVGCIASDFGFSGPSASWAGSVSADRHMAIETKSAEMLHVANYQYDAIKEEWICDEGYAGVGCRQRLCPETVAFTSGTDGFTPSKSVGFSYTSDAGTSTSGTFNNQHSYRECGGRGSCDFETGICQCFPGFTGVGCRRTTCPNSCSGHGVCLNDDVANYHAAGNTYLPAGDKADINTWGNLWASDKFQGCRCDGGWGGNDCSLRQCPRGDDPETQCADDLGDDVQIIECTNLIPNKEHFFKLRFTDLLGNRYNTRAIVVEPHSVTVTDANKADVGTKYAQAASQSIQTALESLPNFAIPKLEVTVPTGTPVYGSTTIKDGKCTTVKVGKKKKTTCEDVTNYDYTIKSTVQFRVEFTDARNSGQQSLLEVVSDVKCASGVQPKFTNEVDPQCTVSRTKIPASTMREKTECSNRGLCNRKTAECNCFDGYTGLACDTVAQTY